MANTFLDQLHFQVIEELEQGSQHVTPESISATAFRIAPEISEVNVRSLIKRMLKFGPITELIEDDSVSEVMVNGPSEIFYERDGKLHRANFAFDSEQELMFVINRMVSNAGRRIDASSPMVDARLHDGSRINAVIPPLSRNGACLTIRKFSRKYRGLDDLKSLGAIDEGIYKFLKKAIKEKKNIIISGGTGSGKTTLLNALSSLIPDNERIVTIEDSAELIIKHPNLVSLESRNANLEGKGEVTIRMLVKNALRMRPDRIIVGEVRGGEAMDMLSAMNTGHEGSLTTLHANSPYEALLRLETMCLMSDLQLPLSAVRSQIIQSLDVIVQVMRDSKGVRRVSRVALIDKNSSEYTLSILNA